MNASDPWPIIRAAIPRVPLIGKTALFHTLGLSENCRQWDLKTELTVNLIRSFLINPSPYPISKSQEATTKDPGIKGRLWVSKVTIPKPDESGIRQVLLQAIEAMKEPGIVRGGYKGPDLLPVEAEWTGYRAGATTNSPALRISEAQKYEELMKEVTSPTTILYFHGGAYYLFDPASHRPTTTKLAKLTNGRCFSVRYRLAPQNPFPAALLDALVAYLSLLYPPPGSLHTPVSSSHIVFAGDSAGGNLSLVLLQVLLQIQRLNLKIRWNGDDHAVPIPAGVACNSPWVDITHSSPSYETNAKYDYLPSRSLNPRGLSFPPDSSWPANPPRRNLYAEDVMLCHPLVSPLAARVADWEGSCPIWIVTGQELLTDEGKYVAMVAARAGVKVVFEEFEAMPHAFALVLQGNETSRKCFDLWRKFINDAVEQPEVIQARGTRYKVKSLEAQELDVKNLIDYTDDEVRNRMRESVGGFATHSNSFSKL